MMWLCSGTHAPIRRVRFLAPCPVVPTGCTATEAPQTTTAAPCPVVTCAPAKTTTATKATTTRKWRDANFLPNQDDIIYILVDPKGGREGQKPEGGHNYTPCFLPSKCQIWSYGDKLYINQFISTSCIFLFPSPRGSVQNFAPLVWNFAGGYCVLTHQRRVVSLFFSQPQDNWQCNQKR